MTMPDWRRSAEGRLHSMNLIAIRLLSQQLVAPQYIFTIILAVGEVERLDVGEIRNKDQFRYIIGFCLT